MKNNNKNSGGHNELADSYMSSVENAVAVLVDGGADPAEARLMARALATLPEDYQAKIALMAAEWGLRAHDREWMLVLSFWQMWQGGMSVADAVTAAANEAGKTLGDKITESDARAQALGEAIAKNIGFLETKVNQITNGFPTLFENAINPKYHAFKKESDAAAKAMDEVANKIDADIKRVSQEHDVVLASMEIARTCGDKAEASVRMLDEAVEKLRAADVESPWGRRLFVAGVVAVSMIMTALLVSKASYSRGYTDAEASLANEKAALADKMAKETELGMIPFLHGFRQGLAAPKGDSVERRMTIAREAASRYGAKETGPGVFVDREGKVFCDMAHLGRPSLDQAEKDRCRILGFNPDY
jgi:hypothetical protein